MPVLTLGGGVVSVETPARQVSVERPPAPASSAAVIRGPRGYPGVAGDVGVEIQQITPAATWTLPVPLAFGRTPVVAVYVDGELVITDVTADATTVSIQFPTPTAGSAVLS